jgi:uncharacterized protein YjeT (DUF2065 family)
VSSHFLIKLAIVLVAAMVTLEGLIITLWPAKVKEWIQEASPGQLRSVAMVEFLMGITIFLCLAYKL